MNLTYPTTLVLHAIAGGSSHGFDVIDATGLTDSFYYTLRSQDSRAFPGRSNNDPSLPALSTALDEQLGLKLEARRGPLAVLVIDSVQEPTEN